MPRSSARPTGASAVPFIGCLMIAGGCASVTAPVARPSAEWEHRAEAVRALLADWPAPLSPEIVLDRWPEPLERHEWTFKPPSDCGMPSVALRTPTEERGAGRTETALGFELYRPSEAEPCRYRLVSIWLEGDAASRTAAKLTADMVFDHVGAVLPLEGGPRWKWDWHPRWRYKSAAFVKWPIPPGPIGTVALTMERIDRSWHVSADILTAFVPDDADADQPAAPCPVPD